MSVRKSKRTGKLVLDTIWPDGVRTRIGMPDPSTAKRLDLRVRAAKVDGSWKRLRQSLNLDKSANMGIMSDLIERYLAEYCEASNRRPDVKRSRLRQIARHIGSIPISNLSNSHVDFLIAKRKQEGAKASTINRDLIVLYHLARWATERKVFTENPLADSRKLKEATWEGRLPTREAIDSVFSELPLQTMPFFRFIFETGCRRDEAIRLKHEDVNGNAATFRHTKGGRPRTVLLTKEAVEAVNAMPKLPNCDYVFYNPVTLRRWYSCGSSWQRARRRAGYPWLRIHDLRRYYGIRLAESGCPMHVIQSTMGHTSVNITEKYYAKFSPEWAGRVALEHLEKVASGY